ncbi:uncharacterized protein LOC110092032 isoform X4 [Dendrobium catenatum]|uniref:uncharacterized protein LOC110092032 isoform X4 n=1 Tax=Dendrobium catenatum TaxID=906689 RepID=UPI00109F8AAF|nr:uncharacterized protein LOC110092032 isoform X4 [Dendrobium catenatum]
MSHRQAAASQSRVQDVGLECSCSVLAREPACLPSFSSLWLVWWLRFVLFSKAPHQAQPAGPSCIQPGGRPKPTHPAHRPACISSGREVFLFESTSLHRKPPSSPPDLLASLLVDGLNPPIQLTDRLASGREAVPNAPFIFLKLVCFILHTWHALSNHKLSGCSSPSSSFILQHKLDTGARELKNDYKALYEH